MKALPLLTSLLFATVSAAQDPVFARATFMPDTTIRGYVRVDVVITGPAPGRGLRFRPPDDAFAYFAPDVISPVTCLVERGGKFVPLHPCPQSEDAFASTVWPIDGVAAMRFFLPVASGAREFPPGIRELRVAQLLHTEQLARPRVSRASPATRNRNNSQNCHLEYDAMQTITNDQANASARAAGVPWAQRHYGETKVVCN